MPNQTATMGSSPELVERSLDTDESTTAPDTGSQQTVRPTTSKRNTRSSNDPVADDRLYAVSPRHVLAPPRSKCKQESVLDLHTCRPPRYIDKSLQDRLVQAYALGSAYLGRDEAFIDFTKHSHLSRNEEKIFFTEESVLEHLLLRPFVSGTGQNKLFSADSDAYYELTNILEARRYTAEPSLRAQRVVPPPIPIWGRDTSSISCAYTLNDFEILGACFRREVEHFLVQLAQHHKFTRSIDHLTDARLHGYFDFDEDHPVEAVDTSSQTQTSGLKPLILAGTSALDVSREPVFDSASPIQKDLPPHLTLSTMAPGNIPSISTHGERTRAAPTEHTSSAALSSMFSSTQPPTNTDVRRVRLPDSGPPDGGDGGDDDDSNGGDDRRRPSSGFPPRRPHRDASRASPYPQQRNTVNRQEAHFDFKLKMEMVPTWDGNADNLAKWVIRINALAKRSPTVRQQLGNIVPQRLTSSAETWYFSLPDTDRDQCEQSWDALRDKIGSYYMNRSWIERTRRLARAVKYRDFNNPKELPSEYFIRKHDLLVLVCNFSAGELITEIMAGAPKVWKTLLTPRLYATPTELQEAIKLHEDDLLEIESLFTPRAASSNDSYRPFKPNTFRARVNAAQAIGWSASMSKPPFPVDDTNVSQKKTPESVNARPCRHCGSGKHWDNECKHSKKGMKYARANMATIDEDTALAQEEYDNFYYEELSDSDSEPTPNNNTSNTAAPSPDF